MKILENFIQVKREEVTMADESPLPVAWLSVCMGCVQCQSVSTQIPATRAPKQKCDLYLSLYEPYAMGTVFFLQYSYSGPWDNSITASYMVGLYRSALAESCYKYGRIVPSKRTGIGCACYLLH